MLGEVTEDLALRFGTAIGALLNVTFGNSVELILSIAVHISVLSVVPHPQFSQSEPRLYPRHYQFRCNSPADRQKAIRANQQEEPPKI